MAWTLDARIPVLVFADDAALAAARAEGAEVLAWDGRAPAGRIHAAACPCCQGRHPAALALDRLFQDRARGIRPWFDRVLAADPSGELAAVLREDRVVAARFRAVAA